MFKKAKGFVMGFLCCAIIVALAGTAIGLSGTWDISVTYRDIQLYVDGNLVAPRDANGNIVEPFIYNGTTYLPVRAVGEAFGKSVEWDGETSTVYLGGRPSQGVASVKLSDLDYFNRSGERFTYHEETNDNTNTYRRDCFTAWAYNSYTGAYLDYLLEGQYTRIEGVFFLTYDARASTAECRLRMWGDGNLIYESPRMTGGVRPIDFSVDISGVDVLKIGFEADGDGSRGGATLGLSNVTLR